MPSLGDAHVTDDAAKRCIKGCSGLVTDQLLNEADSKIVDSIISHWRRTSLSDCLIPTWLPKWLCGTWFEKALRAVRIQAFWVLGVLGFLGWGR
jgi:hypothetical protein